MRPRTSAERDQQGVAVGVRGSSARRGRAVAVLVAALGLIAVIVAPAGPVGAAGSDPGSASVATPAPVVSPEVEDAVADGGRAFVIANLAAPANAPQAIESAGRSVLEQLPEGSYQGEARAQSLPFVALHADADAVDALRSDPSVTSVVLDHVNTPSLVQSVPAIGGDTARTEGFDGAGTAVAIIDTGVKWDHPFFQDGAGQSRVVAESCFSGAGGNYGLNALSLCPNGSNQQTGRGSSFPCNFISGTIFPMPCGHGTHVAGIAAGGNAANNGTTQPRYGVAPKASILASDVFSLLCQGTVDPNQGTCSTGFQLGALDSDIALALEWVRGYRYQYGVAAVNLSVGGTTHYSSSCDASTLLASPISTLKNSGIATVVASGNDGSKAGISSPACVSTAVSVGSWDVGTHTASSFSNSGPTLTLLAPGDRNDGAQGIVSSVPLASSPFAGYVGARGTSMAAPHVAGAIAVLRQADPGGGVDPAVARLVGTGTPVTDTNGQTTPLIDLAAALRSPAHVVVASPQGAPYPGSTFVSSVTVTGFPTPTVSYQWYRCPAWAHGEGPPPDTCTAIAGETGTSHLITIDDIGSHLAVAATATNGVGSPSTAYYSASPEVPALPAQPDAPTLVRGFESITASWAPAWPDGLPILGYQVVFTPMSLAGPSSTLDFPATTTSHQFTGLDSETRYRVTVAQRNVNGVGPASPSNSSQPFGVPGAPFSPSAVAGDQEAAVTWGSFTTGGKVPLGYRVTAQPGGTTCIVAHPASSCTVTGLDNGTAYTFTIEVRNEFGYGAASVPTAPVTPRPGYHPVVPARIMDTRPPSQGGATVDGQALGTGAMASGATRTLTVAGRGGLPATGVSAVALNVTVAGSSGPGFLTVFPSGVPAPNASNLNFAAGQVVPNMVLTEVGPDGKIAIRNFGGNTQVIVDVVGWYREGAPYDPIVPSRYLDTRTPADGGATFDGTNVATGALASGETRLVEVTGRGDGRVPESGVAAVALNVTVAGSSGPGFLTVFPSGVPAPNASNLNFVAGQVVPNMVITKVGADGKIAIRNFGGNTQVIVDVVGWFPEGDGLTSVVPARLMDTRPPSQGGATVDGLFVNTGLLTPGEARTLPVTGRGGVPTTGVSAVALNVTVAGPSAPGFLTVYPSGVPSPNASNLNFVAGQVVPNMVITKVGPDGTIKLLNSSGGTPVIVDVVGWIP